MTFRSLMEESYILPSEVKDSNQTSLTSPMTQHLIARYNRGMTYTPLPALLPHEEGHMVVCDGCLMSTRVKEQGKIPNGWDKVYIEGWVGVFHSCSAQCKEKITRTRNTKLVSKRPIVILD